MEEQIFLVQSGSLDRERKMVTGKKKAILEGKKEKLSAEVKQQQFTYY